MGRSELADRLAGARSVVALTGAGVSVESGVPTCRGPDGLWRRYRPEDLATPEAFARDPRQTPLTPRADLSLRGPAGRILPWLFPGVSSPGDASAPARP